MLHHHRFKIIFPLKVYRHVLEKANDRVTRKVLWWVGKEMDSYKVLKFHKGYVRRNHLTGVRMMGGDIKSICTKWDSSSDQRWNQNSRSAIPNNLIQIIINHCNIPHFQVSRMSLTVRDKSQGSIPQSIISERLQNHPIYQRKREIPEPFLMFKQHHVPLL